MVNAPDPAAVRRIERAASRLAPVERAVLSLSAGEGLRNDQIAARLGISVETAERHLANALCRLDRQSERQHRPWWRFW